MISALAPDRLTLYMPRRPRAEEAQRRIEAAFHDLPTQWNGLLLLASALLLARNPITGAGQRTETAHDTVPLIPLMSEFQFEKRMAKWLRNG